MNILDWQDGEVSYCAELAYRGHDEPRVPATSVDEYLKVQVTSARMDVRGDVVLFLTLLQQWRGETATYAKCPENSAARRLAMRMLADTAKRIDATLKAAREQQCEGARL